MELKEVTHLLTRILHRNDKVNDFFIDWSSFSFSQTQRKAQIILGHGLGKDTVTTV